MIFKAFLLLIAQSADEALSSSIQTAMAQAQTNPLVTEVIRNFNNKHPDFPMEAQWNAPQYNARALMESMSESELAVFMFMGSAFSSHVGVKPHPSTKDFFREQIGKMEAIPYARLTDLIALFSTQAPAVSEYPESNLYIPFKLCLPLIFQEKYHPLLAEHVNSLIELAKNHEGAELWGENGEFIDYIMTNMLKEPLISKKTLATNMARRFKNLHLFPPNVEMEYFVNVCPFLTVYDLLPGLKEAMIDYHEAMHQINQIISESMREALQ